LAGGKLAFHILIHALPPSRRGGRPETKKDKKIFTPVAQLNAKTVYPGLNFEEPRSVFNQGQKIL
jgi:hypothetical protein